jgi:hypothetical protein
VLLLRVAASLLGLLLLLLMLLLLLTAACYGLNVRVTRRRLYSRRVGVAVIVNRL